MEQKCFDPLEGKFAFSILLIVKEYESINKKNIAAVLKGRPGTIGDRVDVLEEAGLIKIEKLYFNQNMHMVSLTEKGLLVAEKVSEIGDILTG